MDGTINKENQAKNYFYEAVKENSRAEKSKPSKANQGVLLNLHTQFHFPRLILRGDMRARKQKNRKNSAKNYFYRYARENNGVGKLNPKEGTSRSFTE